MGNLTSDDVVRTVPGEDRELLELAARAAGYALTQWADEDFIRAQVEEYRWPKWNPLTDDGDALRLAVKLELTVYPPQPTSAGYDKAVCQNHEASIDAIVDATTDHYAATRRAIVRAAAAIAKATP